MTHMLGINRINRFGHYFAPIKISSIIIHGCAYTDELNKASRVHISRLSKKILSRNSGDENEYQIFTILGNSLI
jgi:hypothetical protein